MLFEKAATAGYRLAMVFSARAVVTAAALIILAGTVVGRGAQTPPAAGGATQTDPGLYPALQRPPGDPELVARGRTLYEITCRSCHGADLRGGDLGGPNLLRSQLVLSDQQGELMLPVIRDGISNPGLGSMPPQPLSEDDVRAVAEYIHSVTAAAERQGGPPAGERPELDLLVGDAEAGQTYFSGACASCHSITGDLQGIGSRIPDTQQLQNTWVRGGSGERGAERPPVQVTVTQPSGERVTGQLERLDDFIVVLTEADGRRRSFTRRGDVPGVEVADPLGRHTELLPLYTDTDIHNLTAYLSTLK